MKFIAIIPARYASTRFPGKPLADIRGKTMIQRVYEQARKVFEDCYVATDDNRIYNCVQNFNGNVIMTSSEHKSGTDRCAEASKVIMGNKKMKFDVVINVQGDEPFLEAKQLESLMNCFNDPEVQIATLIKSIKDQSELFNPNKVKVITDIRNYALYFSRATIPFLRDIDKNNWILSHSFFKHIGIYAYRSDVLQQISSLKTSSLEKAESLEQNRWIENGYKIKTAITEFETPSIDTKEDLEFVLSNYFDK